MKNEKDKWEERRKMGKIAKKNDDKFDMKT